MIDCLFVQRLDFDRGRICHEYHGVICLLRRAENAVAPQNKIHKHAILFRQQL